MTLTMQQWVAQICDDYGDIKDPWRAYGETPEKAFAYWQQLRQEEAEWEANERPKYEAKLARKYGAYKVVDRISSAANAAVERIRYCAIRAEWSVARRRLKRKPGKVLARALEFEHSVKKFIAARKAAMLYAIHRTAKRLSAALERVMLRMIGLTPLEKLDLDSRERARLTGEVNWVVR